MRGVAPIAPSHPSGGEGWGEGVFGEGGVRVAANCDQDGTQYAIDIAHDIGVGETQHAVPTRFEARGSRCVIAFLPDMAVAVDFDHQPFGPRGEIRDIGRENDLSLKFDPRLARAQPRPQPLFWFRHRTAQRFGTGASDGMTPCHLAAFARCAKGFLPSPNPLPLKGEGATPISCKAGNAQKN